jgi:hypothetical protein
VTTPQNQTPAVAPVPPPPALPSAQTGQLLSGADIRGLRSKLDDLRESLQDAASRRRTVSDQLRTADEASRPGLVQRMGELDSRIISIEREITATGQQLAAAPPSLLAETAPPTASDAFHLANRISDEIVPLVAIFTVFVLAPIALAMSRFIWRRAAGAPRVAAPDHATQQKLDHLQQAVDTIAIEVERISEGQRFVTRLMNERAVGAGAAEPVHVARKSPVSSERG